MPVINKGRTINYISGLNGVAAGGQAILNIPCTGRYHRLILNCTSAGVAAAVTTIISSIKLIVNGVAVRDIDPANILKILQNQGYYPLIGELPLNFSEPLLTGGVINEPDDVTSWDMVGQNTFQLQIGIQGAAVTPGITGVWEFDYQRNLLPDGSPFLQIVNQHQFAFPIPVGQYDITTLPFAFPIRRLHFYGSNPGQLSTLEVYQDNNKVHEATILQSRQAFRPYGFRLNNTPDGTPFVNATGPANLGVSALVETPAFFEAQYLADADSRLWKALRVGGDLKIRVNSAAAQTLTVVMECIPPGYLG
jgi:hypothetical protein